LLGGVETSAGGWELTTSSAGAVGGGGCTRETNAGVSGGVGATKTGSGGQLGLQVGTSLFSPLVLAALVA
jgi:hypothetical protein